MKKPFITCVSTLLMALLVISCAKRAAQTPAEGGEGADYSSTADAMIVASHVSGPISSEARILVRFVEEAAPKDAVGKKVAAGIAVMNPSAPGDMVWGDERTIEFKPSRQLPRGTLYTIEVFPQKINGTKYKDAPPFEVKFSVMNQVMTVDTDGFISAGTANMQELAFSGVVVTADVADSSAVEKSLTASLGGRGVRLEWEHAKLEHRFTIRGIVKQEKAQELKLNADGRGLDASYEQSFTFQVPLKSKFKIASIKPVDAAERYVEVSFTDPLLASQDFRGFVAVKPDRDLRFSAKDSVLKVYSLSEWEDAVDVSIKKGIKNAAGEALSEGATVSVSFKPMKPEVRFIGNGVIVPAKTGVTVPIETVNLNAVIVEIQKIYEQNIGQFLQINELSGDRELYRVGKTVWKKIVPVPYSQGRRNQWIRSALDLSPLVSDTDHNLYRIILSFDVRMVEYPGAYPSEQDLMSFPLENLPYAETSPGLRILGRSFWDAYTRRTESDYYDDDRYEEYYRNRENPLHPAFYQSYYYSSRNVGASRNFLVSDLGIIAQRDVNGRLTAAVSSLITAEPVGDATVTLLDFQQQKIAQARTDSSGLVSFASAGEGFLLTAESKSVVGYLRLEGASNLPVSHFDVSGQQVQQGIKGFIYGERGVWRPGDPIYLTFILMDKNKVLPADHPVVLKFYNPLGKLVKTMSTNEPVGNFYHFALSTGAEDPTGSYTASIGVGGVSFTKAVSVEAVKPNRLKIAIGFGAGVEELTTQPADGAIAVTWLHGAVAGSMDTDVNVLLSSAPTSFPGYKNYAFDDPVRSFKAESQEVFKGRLDAQGKASFRMSLSPDAIAPGKLTANFKTRVFEAGGNINADSFSMPFHPYDRYAGISIPDADRDRDWLDVEQPHTVKIALVDTKGKPVPRGEVDVDVYEIGWRWWWDMHEDDIADHLGSKDYQLVQSKRVAVSKGAAEWTLKFKEKVWGRYLVRVRDAAGGHTTGRIVYMRWPGWYYTSAEEGGDSANVLMFSADKESYTVGETAKITIPTPDAGKALVSIENNGRLLSTEWINVKQGQTLYQLRITDRMAPNVYVHVSVIQPHGQTVNDRPIRMFGIIPLPVEDPATRLKPVVKTADVFEPESTVTVSVSEASKRAMTYTLAVVDEGLLNLTRFKTPDPWAQFYKRDAMGVWTYDLYGFVAAAYGGTLEKLLAVGGGEEGLGNEGKKANRFPPMVRFLGPFDLEAGKTAEHKIQIPQYVGAVRVMVVAGTTAAFGYAEKEVPVKKPVMVYATLPRVVSVTETFALPAQVFVLENGIPSVDVSVKTNGKIAVKGEGKKTVKFSGTGDTIVSFDMAAGNTPGLAVVEVTAASGRNVSTQKIEMDVRVPNAPITTVEALALKKGESRTSRFDLPGMPGTNEVVVEISKIQPVDLERRLRYLITYPYGCIEQTTSSVFPQLYLNKVTELTAEDAAQVQRNVQAGVDRLQHFLTYSGGFGFWPGDRYTSSWGTVYAAHFLLEAEKLGYVVPDSMKRSVLSFLKTQVGLWAWNVDRNEFVQAYALYDLALAGEPDLGAMNRMRERTDLPVEVRFKLAGAYALAGQKEEALRLTRGTIPVLSPYNELGGTYGSALRDMAILAEGLLEAGDESNAFAAVNSVAKSLSEEHWYSTQTTAYCLLVIGKYLDRYAPSPGSPMRLTYEWEGRKQTVESAVPVKRVTLAVSGESLSRQIALTNAGQDVLFVRVLRTGQPAPGKERAQNNGLALRISYMDKDGNYLDVDSLDQGTDIVAEITVKNPTREYYSELAMTYIVPSGWEISNPRFDGWNEDPQKGFKYQDIRDDRVNTFFDLDAGQEKTLKIMLNASYAGRFYLPQSKAEAMYDASLNAASEGKWVVVDDSAAP